MPYVGRENYPYYQEKLAEPSALWSDLYALTMAQALWEDGRHNAQATFHGFIRTAPYSGQYLLTAGQNVGPESSLLKTRGTEIGQAITELAVELVGYYGIPFNNPGPEIGNNEPAIGSKFANTAAPRYFNYRKASIYAGSNEVQRNIMAKLVLGL